MKSKLALASIICCLFWVSAYSAESEPNDTKAQANTLTLNGNNSGAIGTATDVDWWKVTTNKDGQLSATITISNGLYCWVSLYDNNGTTLLHQIYSTTVATATMDGLAAGVYYVKVHPYYSGEMPVYTIANTLINAAFTNDVEPNNTKAVALTLAVNASAKGHIGYYYQLKRDTFDWYKITTNTDGILKLNLTPSNGQFTWCYLLDNDGTTVLASGYSTTSFNISRSDLAAGTYYVRVNCYYTNNFAPYTLIDSLFPPLEANDAEPNGTKAQALTFATNSTVTGHVGYYYNLKRDTADWYKIVTNKDGMISLTITPGNGTYTWAYLFDNDGTTVLNSAYHTGSITFTTDGLAAGTYYVRVNCYYSDHFSPYTLTNSLTTYTNANDGLSNDYAKLGKTLPANEATPGHVGFRNNGGTRDPIDWWKINYTGGSGNLTVTLNYEYPFNGPTPFTYLRIYKDTASSPIFNTYTSSGNVTANLTGLSKDYYYVAVVMYYTDNSWTAYNLTPTFTQASCVTSVDATKTHSGSSCTNSYITFQVTGGKNAYLQLYRYGVAQGGKVAVDGTGSHKFDNLSPGNYYAVGFSDGATGSCQATSATKTVVPKPKNLTASNVTSTAADVNWTTLSCVKYYFVQYRILGATKWKKKTTAGNVGTYHLTGLTADTTYEFRVAANDSANGQTANGKYSAISTFGTLARLGAEQTSTQNLSVYPNPASSRVYVSFENGAEGEVTMKLFDVTGKIVFVRNEQAASGAISEELDLTGLNTGVYHLQVITSDGSILNQSIVKATE